MVKSKTSREETYACTVDELWKRAGNFGDLSWGGIPNVRTAPEGENGMIVRRITAADGGEFVEGLLGTGEHSYTYSLMSSPPILEVTDYVATLSAFQNAEGKATLKFDASFEVEPDKEVPMIELLQSIYGMLQGGLSKSLAGSS